MTRRPDPDQALFRWVWSDPEDDRPDDVEGDEPASSLPPLRVRVRQRNGPKTVTLWGCPITLGAPRR